ncbi:hypothetical protein ACFQVC_08555 [Streptomyces monticola]|uniref:Peptidase inhibitor family I36 protein n=1 Tax=Streptomyces monticola TaxID=2666263 RepID=A0ABW2JDZ3_9ACTN
MAAAVFAVALLVTGVSAGHAGAATGEVGAERATCRAKAVCTYGNTGFRDGVRTYSYGRDNSKCRGHSSRYGWTDKRVLSVINRSGKTWIGHNKSWTIQLKIKPHSKFKNNIRWKSTRYWCWK